MANTTISPMPGTTPTTPDGPDAMPERRFTLIGGGIASLAAAAFLIRDGDVAGHTITILEETDRLGGSLDAAGSPEGGYVLRGGRMLESKYLCTYDLFASIPTLDETRTVTEEIFHWNEVMQTASKSRLVHAGHRVTAPEHGLDERQVATLVRLVAEPEAMLAHHTIADEFDAAFFQTDFWIMWCSTFAFQPWHSAVEFKRYLARFSHMVAGFNRLSGIMRTVYNQYDSMVRPLYKWLDQRGVVFEHGIRVTDLVMADAPTGGHQRVAGIRCKRGGKAHEIEIPPGGGVIVTLGSMTDASSFGSMDTPPALNGKVDGSAWTFWETIADGRREFGNPTVFDNHIAQSKWVSFTTTLHDPLFFRMVRDFTGNVPGEGGLITFPESNSARIHRAAAPAAFHRPTGQRGSVLGLRLVRRQAGQFRGQADAGLQRAGDRDRNPRSSRNGTRGGSNSPILDLDPLHDAVHNQPVLAAGAWRPTPGEAGRVVEPRLHRPVL